MTLASHLRKDLNLLLRDWKGLAIAIALPAVIILAYSKLNLGAIAASGRNPDAFILVISTTFPLLLVASTALVEERRMGTFNRLARSPASIFFVILSKTLAALALLTLQVLVIVIAAILALEQAASGIVEHTGSLALVLLLSGIAAQTLGLLISAIVSSETQAMQLTSMTFLLMFTLSGFLQPVESIPTVGAVAKYSPMALGYAGAGAALLEGGLSAQMAQLGVMAMAMLGLATLVTRLRRA